MRRLAVLAALAGVVPGCGGRTGLQGPGADQAPRLELAAPADPLAGFARAWAPRPPGLPRDHGPHFEFQTEWWYYTGNLRSKAGDLFAYQLTLFRRGLSPGPPPPGPGLATNQVYFAHLAMTDASRGRHEFAERWSRGVAGLAEASGDAYGARLEDWTIESLNEEGSAVRLRAREPAFGLDLRLAATKPLVGHGIDGLSAKSPEPGNASYYWSYTRMATEGTLVTPEGEVAVTGESWFDHEWSTSALGPEAVGWDWFSLQLSDGRELMFFQIRRRDGSSETSSGGSIVPLRGESRRLGISEVDLGVLKSWTSPATGARYPAGWAISVHSEGLDLRLEPLLTDQEMRTSFTYWEGAVSVSGTSHGSPVTGHGFVELTGYAGDLRGLF